MFQPKRLLPIMLILLISGGIVYARWYRWAVYQEGENLEMRQVSSSYNDGTYESVGGGATFTQEGQLSLGGFTPSEGALLQIHGVNKGVLLPRVHGTSAIKSPLEGMIVFDRLEACLSLYQGGGWQCLGKGMPTVLRSYDTLPESGSVGDMVYDTTQQSIFVHDGTAWISLSQSGDGDIIVGGMPYSRGAYRGEEGKVYFQNNSYQLQLFHQGRVRELPLSITNYKAYQRRCEKVSYTDINAETGPRLNCPGGTLMTALFYEDSLWEQQTDHFGIPEVKAIECCEATLHTYYWYTSDWGDCSVSCGGGLQTRSVECRDIEDAVVDESFCRAGDRPSELQSCHEEACGGG